MSVRGATRPSSGRLTALLLLPLCLAAGAALVAGPARAASGDLLTWSPLYVGATADRDAFFAAAPGPGGTLYACGISDQSQAAGRMLVAKYDAHRQLVWQTAFRPPGAISASGTCLAVDTDGDVVVAGSAWDGAQNDLAVAKFGSGGALLWWALRNGMDDYEGAGGLAVSGDGSVYVADAGWGGPQAMVVKYAADADPAHPLKGRELWQHTLTGAGPSPSVDAYDLALDASGNVYLSGDRSTAADGHDAFVLKVSPSGSRRWLRTWDGSRHDFDSAEHLVVKGKLVFAAGNTASKIRLTDAVLLSYTTGGHRRWVRTWDDGARQEDNVGDMGVDGAGDAYVVNNVWVSSASQGVVLCKYSPTGKLLWQKAYRGTSEQDADAQGLAVSTAGDAWVSGYFSRESAVTQMLTLRYDADGDRRWVRRWSGPPVQPLGAQGWMCVLSGTTVVTLGEASAGSNGSGAALVWRRR